MSITAPENNFANRVVKFIGAGIATAWPKAASDKVSIFEAVQIIGSAKYGASWDGSEFDVVNWPESPIDEAARKRQEQQARIQKGRVASAFPDAIRSHPNARNPLAGFKFAPDNHVVAWRLQQRQAKWEKNLRGLSRLSDAMELLAQRCRDGSLISYARFRSGGHLWPMKASEWNIEYPVKAFLQEGGNKRYFPELQHSGPYEMFVFFDRGKVVAEAARLAQAPLKVSTSDLGALSPYLQLAVKIALSRRYVAGGKIDSLPVREAEVKAAWPEGMGQIPMSDPAVKAIAKVIGFPNPLAIEQGRKARAKGKIG